MLHCVSRPMEHSSADTGRVYRDNRARAEHASLHYVINERGAIQQNVADANIAWSMLRYDSNFPAPYPMDISWTVADANPGITPDYYVISIGIEQPSDARPQGCTGREELAEGAARAALVHLLAWLCQQHSIPRTPNTSSCIATSTPAQRTNAASVSTCWTSSARQPLTASRAKRRGATPRHPARSSGFWACLTRCAATVASFTRTPWNCCGVSFPSTLKAV
ncbi:MAG: N-acetylmuramoyl-L-alanine amidase [Cellvibrionales bacterium]|nr:N-acetylmuramoyl-L-alanine amidase [Cellvibrionales bacterium]